MKSVKEIHNRMLENINKEYDRSEGSFFYDATKPAAIEFQRKDKEIKEVENKLDIENLSGEDLERFINQRTGIERKPATKGTITVVISGSQGSSIKKGDLIGSDTVNFVLLENKVIGENGVTSALAECEVAGTVGNVPAGAIKHFPMTISGLTSVTNTEAVINGYDDESDYDLRQRYYEKIRTPSTSGNKYHYLNWAKEVVGVGEARVFPLWKGDNTVKIVVIDSNKQPASTDLIQEVQKHIDPEITGLGEGQAPIGAFCTVASAKRKDINILVTITKDMSNSLEEIKSKIRESIVNYLKEIAFKKNLVSYAQIGSLILDVEGVLDYTDLRVNEGIENILVENEEVAILGEVVISE